MFGDELFTIPECRPPCAEFAKVFIGFTAERGIGPSGEDAPVSDRRLDGCRGSVLAAIAAKLHPQKQAAGVTRAPLDGKSECGTLLGMDAELDLIGIAFVEAWVQGDAALEIDELWQHLDDASRGCESARGYGE